MPVTPSFDRYHLRLVVFTMALIGIFAASRPAIGQPINGNQSLEKRIDSVPIFEPGAPRVPTRASEGWVYRGLPQAAPIKSDAGTPSPNLVPFSFLPLLVPIAWGLATAAARLPRAPRPAG